MKAKEKGAAEKVKEKRVEGKKAKVSLFTGKRKKAIARASFRKGKGIVKVNNMPLENMQNEMMRLRIQEPLLIMGDAWKQFDIRVNVRGGGLMGQADASRQAIAKGLAEMLGAKAKESFLNYDRNLLVYDPRRPEPRKPPHSNWGARRYKQRSKR